MLRHAVSLEYHNNMEGTPKSKMIEDADSTKEDTAKRAAFGCEEKACVSST